MTLVGLAAVSVATVSVSASAQCAAPASWFPHATTPPPSHGDPGSEPCNFHRWSWQTFLWLTQTVDGDLRFITQMYSRDELFELRDSDLEQPWKLKLWEHRAKGPLTLRPRDSKRAQVEGQESEINQAGDHGILVDQQEHAVYYAIHVNETYYNFIRIREYNLPEKLKAAPSTETFPVGTLEIKSSWRLVNDGEPTTGLYTTSAEVRRLKTDQGQVVVDSDPTHVDRKTVALVGLHVAGVVEGHPEFIWATFELQGNAPLLPPGMKMSSMLPVSGADSRFYKAKTPAVSSNRPNNGQVKLIDPKAQTIEPVTQVVREIAWGGGSDTAQIQALNQDVHQHLGADSASNYDLIGSLWISKGSLQPNITPGPAQGSVRLSNTTMETFRQSVGNCFSCHDTRHYVDGDVEFQPKNLNLSHVLRRSYLANTLYLLELQQNLKVPRK